MGFFAKYKRVFLILAFLLIVVGIAYFLYLSFFKASLGPAKQPTTTPAGPGGQLTPAQVGPGQVITEPETETQVGIEEAKPAEIADGGLTKTTKVSEAPALKPTISGNGTDVNFYNKDDGKFYRLDPNGQATPLTDKVFHNVQNITWAPGKNKAILEYPDGANIVYDFNTGKQATLPKHWEDFNFSPDGNKIISKSIGLDVENRWLAISNSDGSGSKPLEFIGKNADSVYTDWSPNNDIVAMYTRGIDFDRQEVFFVGLNKENFKSTIVEGRGFEPMWSESGDQLAYSVYSLSGDIKPELWVVDAQGDSIGANRKKIGLQTWASKCTFSDSATMYCGVPEYLDEGAGLFPEMAQKTKDDLYKVNIRTGEKELIAIPDNSYNMSNLIISQDGKNLYFTDANSSLLHKIELQ